MGRIKSFEFFRIIMIVMIVFSHFEFLQNTSVGDIYSSFFHNATLAVDFFFTLSGFGLMFSNKKESSVSLRNSLLFAFKKIKKIYGLYVVSLLLCLIPNLAIKLLSGDSALIIKSFSENLLLFLFDLTLLQSASGLTYFSNSINAVGWFISTLFILYLIAPIIMSIIKDKIKGIKANLIALVINTFLTFAVFLALREIEKISPLDNLSYGSPYFRVFFIVSGMLVANLLTYTKNIRDFSILEVVVSCSCILWFFVRNSFDGYILLKRAIDIVLCATLIIVFAFNNGVISKWINNKDVLKYSSYVMYIYLFHYPIRIVIEKLTELLVLPMDAKIGIICCFVIIILTIAFSICVRFFQSYIRRKNKVV